MSCEECGDNEATMWAYDLALCTDCAETIADLTARIAQESSR